MDLERRRGTGADGVDAVCGRHLHARGRGGNRTRRSRPVPVRVSPDDRGHRDPGAGDVDREHEPVEQGGRDAARDAGHEFVMGVAFISGASVSAFQWRATTGGSRQHTDGPAVTVPHWVRLVRRGSLVTASRSSDGVTWATISTMTLSAPSLYVGLAVASATVSTLATGVFDNVVVEVPATNNQPPTVTMTAPANGAPFVAPASIDLAATASDTDGTIAQVTFYNGATPLTTDTSAPYSFTWNGVAAGSYSLTAVAQDNAGATTTSAARTVTVTPQPCPILRPW